MLSTLALVASIFVFNYWLVCDAVPYRKSFFVMVPDEFDPAMRDLMHTMYYNVAAPKRAAMPMAPFPSAFSRKKRDAVSELQKLMNMNLHGKKRSPNPHAQDEIKQYLDDSMSSDD